VDINEVTASRRPGIIGKLREVEMVLSQGGTTAEACRWISVSEQTYYGWMFEGLLGVCASWAVDGICIGDASKVSTK